MSRFTLGLSLEVTVNVKLIFTVLTPGVFALGYKECLLQHQYILHFFAELECPSSTLPALRLLGHQVSIFEYAWQNKVRGMCCLVRVSSLSSVFTPDQEVSGKPPTSEGKGLGSSSVPFAMFLAHNEMPLSCLV